MVGTPSTIFKSPFWFALIYTSLGASGLMVTFTKSVGSAFTAKLSSSYEVFVQTVSFNWLIPKRDNGYGL